MILSLGSAPSPDWHCLGRQAELGWSRNVLAKCCYLALGVKSYFVSTDYPMLSPVPGTQQGFDE